MIRRFLEQNSFLLGITMGIIIPCITFCLLYLFLVLLPIIFIQKSQLIKSSTLLLLSIFPNALIMRFYLLKLQLDKTGRGIMLTTFVLIILYFIRTIL